MHTESQTGTKQDTVVGVAFLTGLTTAIVVGLVGMQPGCRADESNARSGQSTEAKSDGGSEHSGHDHEHGDEGHSDEVTLTADAIKRYGIKVEAASLYKLSPSFIAPARVAFNAEAIAHIGSTLPGRVVELSVRLGDVVNKGDLLLVVESPQLAEAQSTYLSKLIAAETAMATADLAKNAMDRASRLYEQNRGIALDEVQKREIEFKAAQATVKTAEATAVAAENTLHVLGMTQDSVNAITQSQEVNPRFPIVAPISGEVVEREVTLGELVSPEREKLMVLANVETLWVLADVPESHLPELALEAKAWINAGSLDPHQHEGEVSYVAPTIDPRTRTVSVRVAVECEDRSLKPGMFVEVQIASTDRNGPDPTPVIGVPQDAIQTVEGEPSVFVPVPGEENTFARRTVSIGKPVAGIVPVLSGLVEGEAYVASNSFLLKADLGKATAEHQH